MTTASAARDAGTIVARTLLVLLALALVVTVLDAVTVPFGAAAITLRYKTLWRALPIVWIASLLIPGVRASLAPRWQPSDLPLALFAAAAALSVLLGGGRWGDMRSLLAAIGVGLMARSLFAAPQHRMLVVHYFGLTILLILFCEIRIHPSLLPPHEMGRYDLVTANPNVLGFLFGMSLPVLLAETFAATGGRRLVALVYTLATALGTLLTFSRTAGVGAAAGTAIVVLTMLPRGRALAALAVAGLLFLAVQRPDQWTRLRTTGDAQRGRILQTSLALAARSPVFGVGFGINNLERVFPDAYHERYGERVFRFHSMNQVVDLLVGTGLVGTACALWWAVRVWTRARHWLRTATDRATRARAAGGVAACVAIAVMSMGEPPLYHGKLVPILFLLIAVIEIGPRPHSGD